MGYDSKKAWEKSPAFLSPAGRTSRGRISDHPSQYNLLQIIVLDLKRDHAQKPISVGTVP